jgi:Tol biopolymer transport system component
MNYKILTAGIVYLALIGCAATPDTPDIYGKVTVIKKVEVTDDQTGQIFTELQVMEELAEKSVADKGAESLLTAQRLITVGQPFQSYSVSENGRVVLSLFNQEGKGGLDIWAYSSGKQRITKTSHFNYSPSFSNSAEKIYYASKRGKKRWTSYDQEDYIWRVRSSGGGGITRLGYPAYAYVGSVEESSDGAHILYSSREFMETSPFVWYAQVNGSLPTQLTQGREPKWIDEDTISFVAVDENTGRDTIWTLNLDGGMLTQVIADQDSDCLHAAPSPDGRFIAYVKQDPKAKNSDETRDIYVYDLETGLSQQLTTNTSRDDMPRWSNNGSYLLFRSTRGVGWNIWRVDTSTIREM